MTTDSTMTDIILRRGGAPPLQFRGRQVSACDSRPTRNPQDATRWHELVLYEVESDDADAEVRAAVGDDGWPRSYIVAVNWRSTWTGEDDADDVLLGDDGLPLAGAAGVGEALAAYDPLAYLVGFPPADQFRRKQDRLERNLRQGWQRAVGTLLADAKLAVSIHPAAAPVLTLTSDDARALLDVLDDYLELLFADAAFEGHATTRAAEAMRERLRRVV